MAARKKKEVTAEDLERSLEEAERREKALADAALYPKGKTAWDHLLENEEDDDPPGV